jgi:two-component system, LuxR family, sensor kinase FixL
VVRGFGQTLKSDRCRWEVDYRFRKADGSYAYLHDQGIIVRDLDNRALRAVGAMTDVTTQRQVEADLERIQAEMIHMSRYNAMGTMASTLAHELNQPLTAASNFLSGVKRLARQSDMLLPQGIGEAIDSAASSMLRAGEIVRRLRELVGRGTSTTGATDLVRLINEANVLAFVDADAKGITHRVLFGHDTRWVWADRIQIQQVLINLIRNAIEAVEHSPVREIVISTRRLTEEIIEVEVADTGCGIGGISEERLFSQFMTTKNAGLGVGLPISRTIVEAHGGRLRARPGEGGGAVFTFTLPVSTSKGSAIARP